MIRIGYVDIAPLDDGQYRQLYAHATPERQRRADRYLRSADRQRCVVAGALLRYALKGKDCAEPSRTPEGKPYFPGLADFHFNLSHSGRWVAIAWGDCPVGIDVEILSMDKGKEALARRFFSDDEQAYLFAAGKADRGLRFFEIWTKKESYLKYQGTGINCPLNSFSVLTPEALSVSFRSFRLEDAVMTLCGPNTECQIIPLSLETLISG